MAAESIGCDRSYGCFVNPPAQAKAAEDKGSPVRPWAEQNTH